MVVIAPIIIALDAIVSWFVLFGARRSWLYFTSAIAKVFRKHNFSWRNLILPTIGIGSVQVNTAVHNAQDDLGKGAREAAPTTSGWLIGLAAAMEYHAFTVKYLAAATLAGLENIGTVAIPRGARTQTGTTRAIAEQASVRSWAAQHDAWKAEREARQAERTAARAQALAEHPPIPLPRARANEQDNAITRWFARWRKWIVAGIGASAFTGVILRVITRHLPWFKCANVDKAARNLCRMDGDLLDSLIADTLAIAGTLSLLEFVKACQEFEPVFEEGLRYFVRELH